MSDEFSQLQAIKTPILGNTTPGMLSVNKEIQADRVRTKKIRLLNVGVSGNSIVIEDVISKDHPNFYAVPMQISSKGEGAKRMLMGEFVGKSVQIRLEGADSDLPALKSVEPVSAFVMGSMIQDVDSSGKPVDTILATKIIAPWSDE